MSVCKQYNKSDDVGEYAKKEELWKDLSRSPEFEELRSAVQTKTILKKYMLSDEGCKKRYQAGRSFDFTSITENCKIFSNGADFYSKLQLRFFDQLSDNKMYKLSKLSQKL